MYRLVVTVKLIGGDGIVAEREIETIAPIAQLRSVGFHGLGMATEGMIGECLDALDAPADEEEDAE